MVSNAGDVDIPFFVFGSDSMRVSGLDPAVRACRFAAKAGLVPVTRPPGEGRVLRRAEDDAPLYNADLRKREDAYLLALTSAAVPAIERASYDAPYKDVIDLPTSYLWRGAAFQPTRCAASAGITQNMVTLAGIAPCVWSVFRFMGGHYLAGTAVAWWTGLSSPFHLVRSVQARVERARGREIVSWPA